MIDKRFRTYTEKTTSVEQPIEVVQYGVIQQYSPAYASAAIESVVVPTTVPNVKSVTITPLNASAARWMTKKGVYFEKNMYTALLKKKYASNLYVSRTLKSATGAGPGRVVLVGRNLNVFASNLAASTSAQALAYVRTGSKQAEGVSLGLAYHLNEFGSNQQNYLLGFVVSAASGALAKFYDFAYEVRGYE